MAIEPIKGFYVHDEETDTDGVAKVSIEAVQEFEDDIRDETSNWLDEHPEATTTVQDGAVTTQKLADGAVIYDKFDDSLKAFVTPEMFGAVGDGTTDDTAAVQAAFDNELPVVLKKKYKVSDTLFVSTKNKQVLGIESNAEIITASATPLIKCTLTHRHRPVLKDFVLTGGSNLTGIEIDANGWGAAVSLDNVQLNNFTTPIKGNRIFRATFRDLTIWTDGCVDIHATEEFSSVLQFDNVYIHSTADNNAHALAFNNVRYAVFRSCTFEKFDAVVKAEGSTEGIIFRDTWLENVKYYVNNQTTNKVYFLNSRTTTALPEGYDISDTETTEWFENPTQLFFKIKNSLTNVGEVLRTVIKNTPVLIKEIVVYSPTLSSYTTIFKATTSEITNNIPLNIKRYFVESSNTITAPLNEAVGSINIAASYTAYLDIHYTGGSHNFIKVELLQMQTGTYAIGQTEIVEKSTWGGAQYETGAFAINGNNLVFTSSRQDVTYAHLAVEYKVLGNAMRADNT